MDGTDNQKSDADGSGNTVATVDTASTVSPVPNPSDQNALTLTSSNSAAEVAVSTSSKRKVEQDVGSGALTKQARIANSDAAVATSSANAETQSVVALFSTCLCTAADRLMAKPDKDPLLAISIVHAESVVGTFPDRQAITAATSTVFFYGPATIPSDQNVAGRVHFQQCSGEEDMLLKFKSLWDTYDPDVVIGHQLKLFDFWYIVKRAQHLGLSAVEKLGKHDTDLVLDPLLPREVASGAGGANSYPVVSRRGRGANKRLDNTAIMTGAAGNSLVPSIMPTVFNRRLSVPGRQLHDLWEILHGRFSLKDYSVPAVTLNFLLKQDEKVAPKVDTSQANPTAQVPAIAAAHADAILDIMQLIKSLPEHVPFCFRCKNPGHDAKRCMQGVVCKICGEPGHKASHCPKAKCTLCGRAGHKASVCYNNATCRKCLKVGHTAQHCPRNLKCTACGGFGHTEDKCFIAHPCSHCGGRHSSDRCYKIHVCTVCGRKGHMENRCFMVVNAIQRGNITVPQGLQMNAGRLQHIRGAAGNLSFQQQRRRPQQQQQNLLTQRQQFSQLQQTRQPPPPPPQIASMGMRGASVQIAGGYKPHQNTNTTAGQPQWY